MGVYLPNVYMPKDGKVVTIQICPDGSIWQQYRGTVPNAKAVPVPPHGALIDRGAARGSIKPWSPEDERSGCTFDTVKKLMYTLLGRAPTIIPAEPAEEGQ